MNRERWAALGILLVAAAFLFPDLTAAPPGLNNDVAYNGMDALGVVNGDFRIFFPGNFGREPFAIYLQAIGVFLFGPNVFALRFPTGGIALVAVAVAVPLAKALFADRANKVTIALIFATLLAVLPWHFYMARVGWRAVSMPLTLMLAAYFLARAYRTEKGWLTGGFWLGMTFYTYLAARLTPLVPVAFLATELVLARHRLQAQWRGWLQAAVVMSLVALPLGGYFVVNRDQFASRLGQLSPFADQSSDLLQTASDGPERAVIGTFAMFFNDGGESYQLYMPGRGIFDPVMLPFFLFGIVLVVRGWRRPTERVLILWLLIMLIPALVARDRHPHYTRSIGSLPPTALLAALGLATAVTFVSRRLNRPAAIAFASVVLLGSAGFAYSDYFVTWKNSPETARTFQVPITEIATLANANDSPDRRFILLTHPGRPEGFSLMTFEFLYRGQNGSTVRTNSAALDDGLPSTLRQGEEVWLYDFPVTRLGPDDPYEEADYRLRRIATRTLDDQQPGYRRRVYQAAGKPVEVAYTASARSGDAAISVTTASQTGDLRGLALHGSIQPGSAVKVDRLSIRLATADGKVIGQVDRPLYDDRGRLPAAWQVAEQPWFAVMDLPAGLPAGVYRLNVVLYSINSPNQAVSLSIPNTIVLPRATPLLATDRMQRVDVSIGNGAFRAFNIEAAMLREGERTPLSLFWQGPATQLQVQIGNGPVTRFETPSSTTPIRIDVPVIAPVATGDQLIRVGVLAPDQTLGSVPVTARTRDFSLHPPEIALSADFDGVRLDGIYSEWIEGPALDLTVYWRAGRSGLPNRDVEVTLRGSGFVVTRTGQPDNGGAAVASWQSGEVVLDGYTISVPNDSGDVTLELRVINPDGTAVTLAGGADRVTTVIRGNR